MDPITLLIAGLIGAAVAACIAWQAIQDWMERKKREEHARVVDLIRKELAGGRVKVIAHAFDAGGELVAADEWEADQLDAETAAKFGAKSKIRVTL
jgi:hypothetical protein